MTGAPERCTSCGATLAPAAQWCHLCFQPVGKEAPTPAPEVAPEVQAALIEPEPEPEPEQLQLFEDLPRPETSGTDAESEEGEDSEVREVAPSGWPCVNCRHRNPQELDICEACGTPFPLAQLAAGASGSSRRQRRIVAAVVAGLLSVLIVVFLTLLGSGGGVAETPEAIVPTEAPAQPEIPVAPTDPAGQPPAIVFTDIPVPPPG